MIRGQPIGTNSHLVFPKEGDHPAQTKSRTKVSRKKRQSSTNREMALLAENRYARALTVQEVENLRTVVKQLVEPVKGVLNVDDTMQELGIELESNNIQNTPDNRRAYINALLGDCKHWKSFVSGVVLREATHTLLTSNKREKSLLALLIGYGIRVGFRVDVTCAPLAGTHEEMTSTGVEGSGSKSLQFKETGVSFLTFHCAFTIGEYTPTELACSQNAEKMARFASRSQAASLVPILSIDLVSPRAGGGQQNNAAVVLDIQQHLDITRTILIALVKALFDHHVYLEGVIIRLSPVRPYPYMPLDEIKSVAKATMQAMSRCLPPAIGGVMLADFQDVTLSSKLLNEVTVTAMAKPFPITFAWGRVVKQGLMKEWAGLDSNRPRVTNLIVRRLKSCGLASMGQLPKENTCIFITNVSDVKLTP